MIGVNIALFAILSALAFLIVLHLVWAKNGILRLILIGYFSTELFTVLSFLIYEITKGPEIKDLTQRILFIFFLPKAVAKIIFYIHIIKAYTK